MRNTKPAIAFVTLILLALTSICLAEPKAAKKSLSEQISKLNVTAPSEDFVKKLNLDKFYKKHLDLDGFSIVSSQKVNDFALLEAGYLIKKILQNRPDILKKLAANNIRFVIMAHDEFTTDVPEYSDMKPARFWNRRARGLGASKKRPAVSCGEENLLCFSGDPYHQENLLIHEFAHAIHYMAINYIDPEFDKKLKAAYDDAMAKGLWKDKYAAKNRAEYWAEAVQSYFDDNRLPDHDHNHVNTRAELIEYDPALANLVKEQLGDIAWKYKKMAKRDKEEKIHLAGYDESKNPKFAWPKELRSWDTVKKQFKK